ncbi:MAG: SDR family oxidoreductase [Candidatus Omnitrophica bacterium]|nr:SDR family oxidoreductase [Candidatus Omnitrophota bacterium]
MSHKTVLITGGAGFLGSHLCDAFLRGGFKVVAVDNMITGSWANIEHFKTEPHFQFVFQNVSQVIYFPDPVHYILHFASPASPIDYLNFPIQTLKVGALGTHNALGMAKDKKAVFLLASTSEVYGDPLVHPQSESYWGNVNPVGPRGVYDEAKRFAEAMTMAYHNYHNLDTKIIRIFNTYGPRMRLHDGRAIPEFISQALTNRPISVFGEGSQTRSFCYVDDLVAGIQKVLFSGFNGPINIGNPKEMTILQLAQTIIAMTQSQSRIDHNPLPVDDPKVRQPDISFIRKELGWEPKVTLEEGLVKTIAYFKEHFSATEHAAKRT